MRRFFRSLPGIKRIADLFDMLGGQVADLGFRTIQVEKKAAAAEQRLAALEERFSGAVQWENGVSPVGASTGDLSQRLAALEHRFGKMDLQFHRTMNLLEYRVDQIYHNLINALMAKPGGSVSYPESLALNEPLSLATVLRQEAEEVYVAGSLPIRSERYRLAEPTTEADRHYLATHLRRLEESLGLMAALKTRRSDLRVIADLATSHLYHPALDDLFPDAHFLFVGSGHGSKADVKSSECHRWLPDLNLETEAIPLPDASVDLVISLGLLEHLGVDPLFALAEVNRILKSGGVLFLSTPNLASWAAATSVLVGCSPLTYAKYSRSRKPGETQVREWVPRDVEGVLKAAGFAPAVTTQNVYRTGTPATIHRLLASTGIPTSLSGDTIFAVATKEGPVADRYPAEFYDA